MPSVNMPLHDGPQYRRYRASLPTDEDKDDVDIMIRMFARPNYHTPEDLELSFACRMEKDELIQARIRDQITIEDCVQKFKEITRYLLSGGDTMVPLPTIPHAEIEKYWKASEDYINTHKEDDDYEKFPSNHSLGLRISVSAPDRLANLKGLGIITSFSTPPALFRCTD
jgi:hypothetical protein